MRLIETNRSSVVSAILLLGLLGCSVDHNTVATAWSSEDAGGDTAENTPIQIDGVSGPGPAPAIACDLPELTCTASATDCAALIQVTPTEGPGYKDYPVNGESAEDQERSWLRRDLAILVKYAAATVACKAKRWDLGNGGPLGLNDASTETGENPGGYFDGTHENGLDLATAYFQVNTADNAPRAICDHSENGVDAYHCTAEPHLLDRWRTALFIGALFEHPAVRVVGTDGRVGPLVSDALTRLCADGWIDSAGCLELSKLAWEETDQGAGWFYGHHHHMQISLSTP